MNTGSDHTNTLIHKEFYPKNSLFSGLEGPFWSQKAAQLDPPIVRPVTQIILD